jgi:hypothetical protein
MTENSKTEGGAHHESAGGDGDCVAVQGFRDDFVAVSKVAQPIGVEGLEVLAARSVGGQFIRFQSLGVVVGIEVGVGDLAIDTHRPSEKQKYSPCPQQTYNYHSSSL